MICLPPIPRLYDFCLDGTVYKELYLEALKSWVEISLAMIKPPDCDICCEGEEE